MPNTPNEAAGIWKLYPIHLHVNTEFFSETEAIAEELGANGLCLVGR